MRRLLRMLAPTVRPKRWEFMLTAVGLLMVFAVTFVP